MFLYRRAEFARALGVSESTVKRWLTRGQLAYTASPAESAAFQRVSWSGFSSPSLSEAWTSDGRARTCSAALSRVGTLPEGC